jgi:hypothetical protein
VRGREGLVEKAPASLRACGKYHGSVRLSVQTVSDESDGALKRDWQIVARYGRSMGLSLAAEGFVHDGTHERLRGKEAKRLVPGLADGPSVQNGQGKSWWAAGGGGGEEWRGGSQDAIH